MGGCALSVFVFRGVRFGCSFVFFLFLNAVIDHRESRALFDAAYKGDVQRVKELLAQVRI